MSHLNRWYENYFYITRGDEASEEIVKQYLEYESLRYNLLRFIKIGWKF